MVPSAIAALLALALAAAQSQDSILPTLPRGWRTERLDFPLSFAPEIDHAGFEELGFAPGMFDPDSDSYFSYVLAIQLDEEVRVDVAFLESFLLDYYRGLCLDVGASRGLELDPSAITARVEDRGRSYDARIEMFDAFVTGERMDLRLEIDVHPRPGSTELFGLASPLPVDASVWKTMRGLRDAWVAARPVPVLLNHLYVVPDAATYAALRDSEFLREVLAVSEERATVRKDASYSGVYFYGRNTYFEFLPPGALGSLAAGDSGIAFGVERAGGSEAVAARLKEAGIESSAVPVTREVGGEHVPWFRMLGMRSASPALFSLEYAPEFLARWHPQHPPTAPSIARRHVLERYAARLARDPAEKLFEDVDEIYLELDDAGLQALTGTCDALGFDRVPDSEPVVCRGPGVRLVARRVDAGRGVTGFRLRLRQSVERDDLHLGAARVSFEGATASFWFEN